MDSMNWALVLALASFLLLQVGFTVGAIVLFIYQKTDVKEQKAHHQNYVNLHNALKSEVEYTNKHFEQLEKKFEALKSVKVDGWQDAFDECKKKLRSCEARISSLQRRHTQPAEEEEYEYPPAAPVPDTGQQHINGLPEGFGRNA